MYSDSNSEMDSYWVPGLSVTYQGAGYRLDVCVPQKLFMLKVNFQWNDIWKWRLWESDLAWGVDP